MPDKQATDYIFWHNLLSQRDESGSHKDTGITRPSDTTDTETTTVLLGTCELFVAIPPDIAAKTTFLREQVSKWTGHPQQTARFNS